MRNKPIRLGDLLVQVGVLTEENLMRALDVQKLKKKKLGAVLIEEGIVTNKEIMEALEFQLGIPRVDLSMFKVDQELARIVSENFARKNLILPIKKNDNTLIVAMVDPLDIILIDDLEITTGLSIETRICDEENLLIAIERLYSRSITEKAALDAAKTQGLAQDDIVNNLEEAPVVKLVNSIIIQAAQSKASDIHIEPEEEYVRVRFRIDGDLQEIMRPAIMTHSAILTRIKIMAKLNIAEKRKPQDGRIEINMKNRELDLRVSTIPTIYGEKVVIRILDRASGLIPKEKLGMRETDLISFEKLIKSRNGMILVTGPTGSGKSTTLYTALSELNDNKKNIVTVEDPVEYRMEGINQSQVNPAAGYDFPDGLRSLLRQDPDIIMVGEIRDAETATIATRAAITGHLVISTLHTNHSIASINRLLDMGIAPYLVVSSLIGVIGQVLVKKVCNNCKEEYEPTEGNLKMLGETSGSGIKLARGKGCSACNGTGYKGRISIYEIIEFDTHIRQMIIDKKSNEEIRNYLRSTGVKFIEDNCRNYALDGVTSFDEYLRISYAIEG